MKNNIIKSILFLIFIVGCSNDSDNPLETSVSNGLFNLKLGNTATLHFKEYQVKNGVESLINQYEFTSTLIRDTVFNGSTWYSSEIPAKSWVTNKSDGVWQANPQSNRGFDIFMTFKYPCLKGDTIKRHEDNTLVVTIDTTISVPAGTFHCIHYRTIGQNYQENTFVAPGFGVAKEISYSFYSQRKIIIDVKSYSFK